MNKVILGTALMCSITLADTASDFVDIDKLLDRSKMLVNVTTARHFGTYWEFDTKTAGELDTLTSRLVLDCRSKKVDVIKITFRGGSAVADGDSLIITENGKRSKVFNIPSTLEEDLPRAKDLIKYFCTTKEAK